MVGTNAFFGIALLAAAPGLLGSELQTGTLKAWEEYIRGADLRMQGRLAGGQPFLWMDESQDRMRRIRLGETAVAPVVGHGTWDVPNGLIHDWIGGVFIPSAKIESLLAVMHDYNRYKDFYKPVVADSKLLACTDTDQRFSMVWQRKVLFVNAAIQGEFQGHDVRVDARHGYGVADSTKMQEIEDFGHAEEHLLAPGTGSGFIWRLHSVARYEERDGGVYLELEAIALTRDIPASVRWLVNPVVNHLSRNSLATTLHQTRDAVNSLRAKEKPSLSCPD